MAMVWDTRHISESQFFAPIKGEFDAMLKWPFEHKISMILVGKIISLLYNLNVLLNIFPFNGDAYTSFLTTLSYFIIVPWYMKCI